MLKILTVVCHQYNQKKLEINCAPGSLKFLKYTRRDVGVIFVNVCFESLSKRVNLSYQANGSVAAHLFAIAGFCGLQQVVVYAFGAIAEAVVQLSVPGRIVGQGEAMH